MIAVGNDKGSQGFGLQIAHERTNTQFKVRGMNDTGSTWTSWATIWTSAIDGSGSGLDADTLDGVNGASYLRSDADDTVTAGTTYTWAATDTEGLRFTGTGTAASKDVIVGNTTLSQNTLAIADQTHAASNYTFSGATMTFNITEKVIDTNFARVYDGTNVVSNSSFSSATGLIGSETITMASGSGTVATPFADS